MRCPCCWPCVGHHAAFAERSGRGARHPVVKRQAPTDGIHHALLRGLHQRHQHLQQRPKRLLVLARYMTCTRRIVLVASSRPVLFSVCIERRNGCSYCSNASTVSNMNVQAAASGATCARATAVACPTLITAPTSPNPRPQTSSSILSTVPRTKTLPMAPSKTFGGACVSVHVYVCVYACVYVYVCICAHVCGVLWGVDVAYVRACGWVLKPRTETFPGVARV